jgi:AcrR family transcriptional regulator
VTTAEGTRAPRLPREQRRQQVLAAALDVFAGSGYHSASMDEIAERAGVSKPVLYQHFPGKLDLYLALLDAGIDELMAAARAALSGTTDNATRVAAMVNAYFDFVENPNGAYRLVFEGDMSNEPAVRQRVDAADLTLAQMSAAVISEDTGLAESEALLIASGMQGLVHVAARRWLRRHEEPEGEGTASEGPPGESPVDRLVAAELVTSLAWRGISGFPLTHPPQANDVAG